MVEPRLFLSAEKTSNHRFAPSFWPSQVDQGPFRGTFYHQWSLAKGKIEPAFGNEMPWGRKNMEKDKMNVDTDRHLKYTIQYQKRWS